MPAKTPLSETISNAVRKRGFQFVGPVIVYVSFPKSISAHTDDVIRTELVW
jgi:3-methyladenine DNA glycosylase Tag